MNIFRVTLFAGFAVAAFAADYKAGVASAIITPEKAIYLSGYAARTRASEGKLIDIYAKALAISGPQGKPVVIVTTDLIGLPRSITDVIGARVEKQFSIPRAHILINSSHTHSAPMITGNLEVIFELNPEERAVVKEYSLKLTDTLVTLIGAALGKLEPADLYFGNSEAHFGINRRAMRNTGVSLGVNAKGPTDPDVPVLKVMARGKLLAVLMGYACHNTTLGGDQYLVNGDYAGFAQRDFEKAHPGATAMFMILCGADQNPNPRGKVEQAEQYGKELAGAADKAISGKMTRLRGPIKAVYKVIELPFAYHTRETFESRLGETNVYRVRNAKLMLKAYDEGHPIRSTPYPVQAIAFGKDLTMLALGGEVVIDYVLRVKHEYGAQGIVVAGYSNDVMSYIPSLRVLREGGYEAVDSMLYYGQPGPYDESVEELIFAAIHDVMNRVGRPKL